MKKVTMYSTVTCHFCHLAEDYFKENNIEVKIFDVGKDHDKAREMMEKSGQMGVPVILIGNEVIVGFDKPRIEEALKE
ncbi:NrdH-redoxin [archaeon]|nr:NrdH-redoxin [archaeon]